MAIIRKTIEHDEPYLRQISLPALPDDGSLEEDIRQLEEYCLETECYALAAVQIGIPKRIVYLKNTDPDIPLDAIAHNEARVLIDPVVVSRRGLTQFWESWLSCLDNVGLVNRPYEMVVEYKDIDEQLHTETFTGFEAAILSHELDHLDGILHIDIAKEIRHMTSEEKILFRKTHPYRILSTTCRFPG